MTCKRTVYDLEHPGQIKVIEVPEHAYYYAGIIPNTGPLVCMFCGERAPDPAKVKVKDG
jgi:hypothetical protein